MFELFVADPAVSRFELWHIPYLFGLFVCFCMLVCGLAVRAEREHRSVLDMDLWLKVPLLAVVALGIFFIFGFPASVAVGLFLPIALLNALGAPVEAGLIVAVFLLLSWVLSVRCMFAPDPRPV